ncbi:substrate-binding domain-containing protein [Actinokineospora sp. NBRC 105648]|uniref:sugar ABC transporter substrate-binding protein n=1 Tax=Actinokineospora sp. NBRC 105648 TaxID=3032206 RepID=UPI0024A0690A|nr:substrate-binding domain-containing protein [Actinokineospora sp. NBRC 105648]GLZ42286.1 hypothetical protein Acsp05_59100 [Actinokineospora sp. NBRC 105648]
MFPGSRRSPLLGALGAAVLLLSACGGASDAGTPATGKGTPLKVAFANYTEAGPVFHATTVRLDQQVAETGAAVEIKWFDNAGDPAKMLSNANLMVQAKPDVLIEYPVAENSAGVKKVFEKSGIPCIALNLPLQGCAFINIDNPKMGKSAAAIAAAEAKKRGWTAADTTVLIGQNATAGPSVNGNVTAFYSAFADAFGLPPVAEDAITPTTTTIGANGIQFDGKSDQNVSFNAVRGLLAGLDKGRKLVLYTCNDDETQGAYRAVQDAGRSADVIVVGHGGGREDTLKALRDDPNWIAQDVFFEEYWGEYVIAMAQAMKGGATPPELTILPSTTIGKADLGKFYDPATLKLKLLPPLDETNSYLAKGGFLQLVGNIEGLK